MAPKISSIVFALVLLGVASAQVAYSTRTFYNPTENTELLQKLQGRKAPPTPEEKRAADNEMLKVLEAALDAKPTMMSSGHIVTELHPPVKVTIARATKVRRIPHHAGEILRRVPSGTTLVATAASPDLLWLRVGENEYIPTRDCNFAFADDQRSAPVVPVEPPMNAHVAEKRVVVRKIANIKGKPVGYLANGDHVKIIGVTPDFSYAQIGHKQFVPITVLQAGDSLVTLDPPLTIHAARICDVYDQPTDKSVPIEGTVISQLGKNDVVTATATSADHAWLRIAPNAFVKTECTRMGIPHPDVNIFPEPLMVKIKPATVGVLKNPQNPDLVLRRLTKGDQLQAFGVTTDFRFLVVAHHRYIPLLAARLVSPLPKEVPLTPAIKVKLAVDETIRHIPDTKGRTMMRGRKGDKFEAIAVTEDFDWVKLGERMYVPLLSIKQQSPEPVLRTLSTPITVTLKEDVALRAKPDATAKTGKTLAAGGVYTAIAATPDAEWLKLSFEDDKSAKYVFIPATAGALVPVTATAPLEPPVTVVTTRDTKVFQRADDKSVIVQRIARGELLKATATTTDLLWLQIGNNRFVKVGDVAHIPSLIELIPAVTFVVATPVKARNIAAFSGLGIHTVEKGTVVVATASTADYRWVQVGEGRFLPTSALILNEGEGVDALAVLKERSGEAAKKATRGGMLTFETLRPRMPQVQTTATTPVGALQLADTQGQLEGMSVGQYNHLAQHQRAATDNPAAAAHAQRVTPAPIKQVRVVSDTPVMNAARSDAVQVRTLRKGTLVTVFAVDQNMKWLQLGPSEFIQIAYTDVAEQVKKHQM